MLKNILKKNLVLIIILSIVIISLESTISRNNDLSLDSSYLTEPNVECSIIQGDSFSDFIVVENRFNTRFHLFLGNGTGDFYLFDSFKIPGDDPIDIITEDFNKDGLLDVAVPWYKDSITRKCSVFLGEDNGIFEEPVNYVLTNFPDGIIPGDFNNDNNIDLAITCHESSSANSFLDIFLGYGNGSFGPKWSLDLPKKYGQNLVTDYLNDDSFLDLAIVSKYLSDGYLTVVFGNGTGEFYVDEVYISGDAYFTIDVIANDFNLDEFIDLAVTNWWDNKIRVFYNDGNGKFSNYSDFLVGEAPKSLDTGDFNMDGFPDIAVTIRNKLSILINDGTGGFESPLKFNVGSAPERDDLAINDFDEDSILDIIVTNSDDDDVTFLHGYGNGSFGERKDFYANNMPVGIAFGNFNPLIHPILNCDGILSWSNVKPGSTVSGTITIENIGAPNTYLDWEIESYPEWGDWIFNPINGTDLTPEYGPINIDVKVKAPGDINKEFNGTVKIVNLDVPNDYCEVNVYLKTPRNKVISSSPLLRFLERYPLLNRLLNVLVK